MRRRDFIIGIAGSAAWPIAVRAQQTPMPVIGHLHTATAKGFASRVAGFRNGLKAVGFVEGQNIAVEYRWAEGQYDRVPALAADLVNRQVAAIVTDTRGALAAKAATTTIPIVFTSGGDPVKLGLVASLNRPGGNITGVSFLTVAVAGKRLELLRELNPRAGVIGYLVNPNNPTAEIGEAELAAHAQGLQLHVINVLNARGEYDLDQAFANIDQRRPDVLFVGGDPLLLFRRDELVALVAQRKIPTIYNQREYVVAGGLMSYGTSLSDAARLAGTYVARILKGEMPANLPVQQSTKFELVINLKTANALGLTVPLTLQVAADEVIE
jgi:putative tryptophan/tyrosine transport system substrate-binding protein